MKTHLLSIAILLISILPSFSQKLSITPAQEIYKPLDEIRVQYDEGDILEVLDGKGRVYYSSQSKNGTSFNIGGTLGYQQIVLKNKKGIEIDRITIQVQAKTELQDEGGKYSSLLNTLYWTMSSAGHARNVLVNGRFYNFFVRWLRDHVHTLKGMKYFEAELKSGIDLYADHQREDGMIWDNIHKRYKQKNWWEKRFSYGGFYGDIESGNYEFRRIPVENDVEYLFIEGIYNTWKATGSDEWMKGTLDKALKAIGYSTKSEYRWSEKFQLLKRGYTIDTWDFQTTEDAMIAGGDIMVVFPDKTRFGVMFGDNTGMYASCNYLGEMLRHVGRNSEAQEVENLGKQLKERIDKLAWNGSYYTHHVPENPNVVRDLGVDEKSQVSLSNAYSLNRGLTHEQSVSIIKTYLKIKEEMPASSTGEWYTIYPPFEKGFGRFDSSDKWEYMNGGVTSIVAGELAHGAFEHGYETYGVDILDRVANLASETDNYLHSTYRGAMPEKPQRSFETIPLNTYNNVIYPSVGATFEGKTFYEGTDNGTINLQEIPFHIPDPDSGNTAVELSNATGLSEVNIKLNKKASSLYFLHNRVDGKVTGTITLEYADGTTFTDYLTQDKVGFWWSETLDNSYCKKGWRADDMKNFVGLYVYGLNNPNPGKLIESIHLKGTQDVPIWHVAGLTLSDSPVYFEPSRVSHGIPDNWGAGAVTYALVEGLIGVKDIGVSFDKVQLSPKWEAANVSKANSTIKYEASGGYISYSYNKESDDNLEMTFTGSSSGYTLKILLPKGKKVMSTHINGVEVDTEIETIEDSKYVVLNQKGIGVYNLGLQLE